MITTTSIIPGLLLLLVYHPSHARNTLYKDDDDSALQPILSQSRRTRICSDLCMSGLGGTPCGDSCFDLIPTNLPVAGQEQSSSSSQSVGDNSTAATTNNTTDSSGADVKNYNATTRKTSCDVLCKNRLGYPLCSCTYDDAKLYAADFVEVCSTFCSNHGYQLFGCQDCSVYKKYISSQASSNSAFDTASLNLGTTLAVDWGTWCKEVCSSGNGGAACSCDLLP